MGLAFIPKISYGSGPTVLTLTWPQKLWTPSVKPVGGSAWSDSGVPEAFIIRRDQMIKVEIRFTEAEWPNVDTWLNYAQQGNQFDFYFDKNDGTSLRTCYLISPNIGDGEVNPARDTVRNIYSLQLTLRSVANSLIDVRT